MKKEFLTLIFAILFLSGCNTYQNVDALSSKKKFKIYQSVLNEINYYKSYGKSSYHKGNYKDAKEAYEKVNFYEDKQVYSQRFLKKLDGLAKSKGKYYYKKALSLIEKDKIKAMYLLNKMMRNYPTKEGFELFQALKDEEQIKTFINKKENNLQKLLKEYDGTIKSMGLLNKEFEKLSSYDKDNKTVLRVGKFIQEQYIDLLSSSIALYEKRKYIQAKINFNLLQSIYYKDRTTIKYLNLISLKQDLLQAYSLIDKNKYEQVIKIANNILKKYPYNSQAKNIIKTCNNARKKQIPEFVRMGVECYTNQDFKSAKKIFEKILVSKPSHKVALAYIKKIDQQLKTIKNLR